MTLPKPALKLAHRGLRSPAAPENSFAALTAAARAHWDGSELDIHISLEGIPFVFHDDNLARLCGIDAAIYDTPAQVLSQLRLAHTSETIPRYDAVLARFAAQQILYSEIKIPAAHWQHEGFIRAQVTQVLAAFAPYRWQYRGWIASFHPLAVQCIRAVYPDLALSICDKQTGFDQHYARFGDSLPYALSHRQRIDHRPVPLERILYWDIDSTQPVPQNAWAHLWDA